MFLAGMSVHHFKEAEDPYFFLTPQMKYDAPVEIPFDDIDKKGASIRATFWKIPQPEPTWFGIIPVGSLSDEVMIKMRGPKYFYKNKRTGEHFNDNNPQKEPMFLVELFKINADLTKTQVFNKTYTSLSPSFGYGDGEEHWQRLFFIIDVGYGYDYGQYEVVVTTLLEMPELKDQGNLQFFLSIASNYGK